MESKVVSEKIVDNIITWQKAFIKVQRELTPEQKKRIKELEKQKEKRRPQRERSGDRRKTRNRRPKRVRVNRR